MYNASPGLRPAAVCPHTRTPPLPKEAPSPSLIAPLAHSVLPLGPLDMVDVSTDLGLHDPAAALPPTPLASLVPGVMGTAPWPKARGAVGTILRLERFQPPRHRALDARVLARRRADRAWSALRLLDPDALHGRRLVASTAPTLGHVVPVLGEVLGRPRRRPSIEARRAGRARLPGGLAQNVCVDARRQGRAHPRGIVRGWRCKVLQVGWDGWGSHRLSRLAVPLRVRPGGAFPPGGRVGRTAPPARGLCAAQTATLPRSRHCACRSRPATVPASLRAWSPWRARGRVDAPRPRPGCWSPGPPCRDCDQETGGSPTFPRSPSADMPRSETPVVSCALAIAPPGLLPSGHWTPSACLSGPP